MAFGESSAVFVGEQGAVMPLGLRQVEGLAEEDLAGGGFEQVGSADDFGDLHGGVVDGDGELVGRDSVFAPDEEVAEIFSSGEGLMAEVVVIKFDNFVVGDAKAPVDSGCDGLIDRSVCGGRPAGSGVKRLIFVGGLGELGEVFAGAVAGVDAALFDQFVQGGDVEGLALALVVGGVRAADAGAFLPLDS